MISLDDAIGWDWPVLSHFCHCHIHFFFEDIEHMRCAVYCRKTFQMALHRGVVVASGTSIGLNDVVYMQ